MRRTKRNNEVVVDFSVRVVCDLVDLPTKVCDAHRAPLQLGRFNTRLRRGGRAVDRAGLENRKAERPREFESHPLRHPASR